MIYLDILTKEAIFVDIVVLVFQIMVLVIISLGSLLVLSNKNYRSLFQTFNNKRNGKVSIYIFLISIIALLDVWKTPYFIPFFLLYVLNDCLYLSLLIISFKKRKQCEGKWILLWDN